MMNEKTAYFARSAALVLVVFVFLVNLPSKVFGGSMNVSYITSEDSSLTTECGPIQPPM
jgi:hypothetical protein